jgi:hypothetical protein
MRSTSISSPVRGGFRKVVVWGGLAAFGIVAIGWIMSLRVPKDSPLARMYRTEADLRALVTAVEMYRRHLGVYPPGGREGLRAATKHLSRNVDYLPQGPPNDGWDRPYVYVPHTEYARLGSRAFTGPRGAFAPQTFQIYSVGRDGDAGLTNPELARDNIVSWDPDCSWRAVYKEGQSEFMRYQDGKSQNSPDSKPL